MTTDTMSMSVATPSTGEASLARRTPRHPATGPILAAVGPNDSSPVLRAARYVGALTTNDVLAVGVIEPPPAYLPAEAPGFFSPEFIIELQDERRVELARQVREASGTRAGWKSKVLLGDPARVAADESRAERSPLLIMGVGRHRPIDRLLSHETTLRAIRRASCPVLAISPDFDPPFRKVVVATDFSPASARAAEALMPLLADGAELHLVHVWQPIERKGEKWRTIEKRYDGSLPDRFHRFRSLLNVPAGITVTEEVRQGKTAERLLDFASANHADLVVAGRHGVNPLTRLMVGSTTTALLRGARCSLLIAPEPTFGELVRLRRVLTGVVEFQSPESWKAQLEDFTHRNCGRLATLELEDLELGTQVLESGYCFDGAAYDEKDEHVTLMLSAVGQRTQHVTRSISGTTSVAIGTGSDGRDLALRIGHGPGQTLLTFSPQ